MKVLLINAPYERKADAPPLGLAYIAAVLKEHGHTVKIIDGALPKYAKDNNLINCVEKFSPDLVGVSVFVVNMQGAVELARKLKQKFDFPILFGGPHPTSQPLDILKEHSSVDAVVIKEGEYTVKEICDRLEANKSLKGVEGVFYRDENDNIIQNPLRKPIGDLNSLPMPARELLENKLYKTLPHQCKNSPVMTMISSRGCAYRKCSFCFEAGEYGSPFRRMSPEKVIEELKVLVFEYGAKEISFWDDNFTQGKVWVSRLCELIIKEGLDISWSVFGYVNMVTPEVLKLMAKAGCWMIAYGVESGNQDLLDKMKKGITLEQVRNATQWTNEAGIESRCFFMLALPGETPAKGMQTINFALELNIDYAVFVCTNPLRGTPLYDICRREGRVLDGAYGFTRPFRAPFLPEGYQTDQQIIKLLKLAYRRFFLRPKQILRFIKKINSPKEFWRYFQGFMIVIGVKSS